MGVYRGRVMWVCVWTECNVGVCRGSAIWVCRGSVMWMCRSVMWMCVEGVGCGCVGRVRYV